MQKDMGFIAQRQRLEDFRGRRVLQGFGPVGLVFQNKRQRDGCYNDIYRNRMSLVRMPWSSTGSTYDSGFQCIAYRYRDSPHYRPHLQHHGTGKNIKPHTPSGHQESSRPPKLPDRAPPAS